MEGLQFKIICKKCGSKNCQVNYDLWPDFIQEKIEYKGQVLVVCLDCKNIVNVIGKVVETDKIIADSEAHQKEMKENV